MRLSRWTMLAAAAATLSAVPAFAQQTFLQQPDSVRTTVLASYNDDYYAADSGAKAPSAAPAAPSAADANGGGCGCNSGCNSGCGCNEGCCESCGRCRDGLCSDWFRDLSVNGGVVAFRGPLDLDDFGTHGNFGIENGVNWGLPLTEGIGTQIGGNYVTTDDTGDDFGHRDQYFVTTAIFHRPDCDCGWQGGIALDYMHETWDGSSSDHTPINLAQIRGNISYVNGCREFGFQSSTGVRDSNTTLNEEDAGTILVRAADIYEFYYAKHMECGGVFTVWGGYANQLGGIVGADVEVPLNCTLALDTGFNYVIPQTTSSSDRTDPQAYESWTVGVSLVWHPCCHALDYYRDPYRPLFKAADNSNFFFNGPNAVP